MKRARVRVILLAFAVAAFYLPVVADSLQLRDGRHFDGKYVGGTEAVVAFYTQGATEYFPVSDVLVMVFAATPAQTVGPLGEKAVPKQIKPSSTRTEGNHNKKVVKHPTEI